MLHIASGSAMLAIWLKHMNRAVSSVELEGLLKARWSVERACYMTADNVLGFCKIWTVGTVFCSLGENGGVDCKFLIKEICFLGFIIVVNELQ